MIRFGWGKEAALAALLASSSVDVKADVPIKPEKTESQEIKVENPLEGHIVLAELKKRPKEKKKHHYKIKISKKHNKHEIHNKDNKEINYREWYLVKYKHNKHNIFKHRGLYKDNGIEEYFSVFKNEVYQTRFMNLCHKMFEKYGVPVWVMVGIAAIENRCKEKSTNGDGPFQMKAGTYKRQRGNTKNRNTLENSIEAAAILVKKMFKRYGSWDLACLTYNQGDLPLQKKICSKYRNLCKKGRLTDEGSKKFSEMVRKYPEEMYYKLGLSMAYPNQVEALGKAGLRVHNSDNSRKKGKENGVANSKNR